MKKPVFRKPPAPPAAESAEGPGLAGAARKSAFGTEPDPIPEVEADPDAAPGNGANGTGDAYADADIVAVDLSAQDTFEEVGPAASASPEARASSEAKENYDKYLRAVAELENFKKRSAKERSELLKYAAENLGRDMLEIADNLQLAMKQDTSGVDSEFLKGIKLIYDRFLTLLEHHGIRGQSSLGEMFDPNKQQALASVPTSDKPPGTILEEFKKAYFYKDKLLRPGQVVVAAAEGESPPDS